MGKITLGSILHMAKGKKPKAQSKDQKNGYLPYVDIKAFEKGIVENYADPAKCLTCNADDVLLVCDGARAGLVGRAIPGIVGSTLALITADGCSNNYLFYFLQGLYTLLNTRQKGTGTPHVNPEVLKAAKLIVPSLPEQERIVARIEALFSQLDAAVAELQTVKEKLNVYRQSILKGQIQNYPHEMRPLSDFIEKPRYGTSKKCVYEASDSAIPVYRIPNIDYVSGRIDHADIKKASFTKDELLSLTLKVGDILIIRSNGSLSLVGRAAMVSENDISGVFAGYLIRIRIKDGADLLPSYLLHTLSSHEARSYIEKTAKSTNGVNNINSGEILKMKIPVCSVDNQKRILDRLETHLPSCDMILKTINHDLQQVSSLRQTILKQAFEGNL